MKINYNKSEFERAFGLKDQLEICNEGQIVFAGKSNVGKSSLINSLFNKKNLAHVSSVPGKTITINYYRVDGHLFVDLPGYGYAKVSHEEIARFSELTQYYFEEAQKNILLTILLIDIRRKPSSDDLDMIAYLQANKINFIVVLTKADKLNKKELEEKNNSIDDDFNNPCYPVIPFSSLKLIGLNEIKYNIEKAFEK